MENKYDDLREKGMFVLLTISPVIIGFFYWVMTQLPVVGKIWVYAAPFTILYYWGWVGSVFYSRVKKWWKALLSGNLVILLSFLIFCWQLFAPQGGKIVFLTWISQLSTMPFLAITMWLQPLIEGKFNMEVVSNLTLISTQVLTIAILMIAFIIGYKYSQKKEVRAAQEEAKEEQLEAELEEVVPIFSDKLEEADEKKN